MLGGGVHACVCARVFVYLFCLSQIRLLFCNSLCCNFLFLVYFLSLLHITFGGSVFQFTDSFLCLFCFVLSPPAELFILVIAFSVLKFPFGSYIFYSFDETFYFFAEASFFFFSFVSNESIIAHWSIFIMVASKSLWIILISLSYQYWPLFFFYPSWDLLVLDMMNYFFIETWTFLSYIIRLQILFKPLFKLAFSGTTLAIEGGWEEHCPNTARWMYKSKFPTQSPRTPEGLLLVLLGRSESPGSFQSPLTLWWWWPLECWTMVKILTLY